MIHQKLRELGWEILIYSLYSPDLVPSDYHLFLSLQNSFKSIKLALKEVYENHLSEFFVQKTEILQGRDYDFTSKIAKSDRLKQHIFGVINFI